MLHKYASGVAAVVGGTHESLTTSELAGGARIHFILHDIFVKARAPAPPLSAALPLKRAACDAAVRRRRA